MKRHIPLLLCLLLLTGCVASPVMPTDASTAPSVSMAPSSSAATQPQNTAAEILAKMSLEQRVGQMFLARCPVGTAVQDIAAYQLGGYLLFSRDFNGETVRSVTDTIASYQAAAAIPMLIAVDEEGGTVTRVSRYKAFRDSEFRSPRELYAAGGMDEIRKEEAEKAALLTSLGVNVNMGPVCDVTTDPSAFMYERALGQDAKTTGDFVTEVLAVMQEYQLGSVLKHFPGYGDNDDTHIGIAVDDRSYDELKTNDLIPFQAGIDAGCDAILVSHTILSRIDPDVPATLSEKVHQILRQDMGFSGVIITDDLVMEAITDVYGPEEAAILAVLAGNDMLCSTQYEVQYRAVLYAVQSGRIKEETVNEAVLRILLWKLELGLL